ncbi:hypothetical protein ACLKA7_007874 [Drosophila subpalustris]
MGEMEWSRQSVIDFKSFFREVFIDWSITNNRPKLRGVCKVVEIDESASTTAVEWWEVSGYLETSREKVASVQSTEAQSYQIDGGPTIVWRAHTQNIERLWRDMKDSIGKKKEHYIGYLAKFQFFKANKSDMQRAYELFMAIGRLYDPYREAQINEDAHATVVNAMCKDDNNDP